MTKTPRRVLFDCEKIRYPNTGLNTYCLNLGNTLIKETDASQEQLTFYTPSNNPAPFGNGHSYHIVRKWHKFFNPSGDIDVWHCNYHESNYLPQSRKTKLLITIHDLNFLIDDVDNKDKHLRKVQDRVDRADFIVCTSIYTQKCIVENLRVGSAKMDIVYDGCHQKEFPGFDQPVYRPLKPFIFTIGIFFRKKNFHVLPALLKNNDYELVIAGIRVPDYEEVIMEQARLHQVADRVKLVGPVTEEDKYWYYKNCSAFAFPSLAEGFGLPVVEAMYFGKPLFLSSHTCLPEIGGDLAFYFDRNFDPEDMRAVFESGMNRYNQDLGNRLRQRACDFSWEKCATSYLKIYREI